MTWSSDLRAIQPAAGTHQKHHRIPSATLAAAFHLPFLGRCLDNFFGPNVTQDRKTRATPALAVRPPHLRFACFGQRDISFGPNPQGRLSGRVWFLCLPKTITGYVTAPKCTGLYPRSFRQCSPRSLSKRRLEERPSRMDSFHFQHYQTPR